MASTKEILAEEVDFWSGLNFDISMHLGLAGKSHRIFMADIGQTGQWVDAADGHRCWYRAAKTCFFDKAHRACVFHSLRDEHPASATLGPSLAIEELVDTRSHTVEPLVHVDSSLDGFGSQIGTLGYFDFLVFLDELDSWHACRRSPPSTA